MGLKRKLASERGARPAAASQADGSYPPSHPTQFSPSISITDPAWAQSGDCHYPEWGQSLRLKSRPLSTRLSPSYRHEAPLASTSELTAIPPATLAKVLIYEARDE